MKKRILLFGLLGLMASITTACVIHYFHAEANDAYESEEGGKSIVPPDEDWYASHFYPNATPDMDAVAQALQAARLQAASRSTLPGGDEPWQTEGPGNIGARINCIAINPSNENVIYVGYARGGVWRTTDGGNSWQPIFDNQSFLSIGAITIDPNDNNTVYVGTGDLNISGYASTGDGLWRSTNGGNTWTNIGLANTKVISSVVVEQGNANHILVGTMGNPFNPDANRGMYRSTDGGATWTQVLFTSTGSGVISMEADPYNAQTIYASTWNRYRTTNASPVSGPDGKVWKSTDGGATWVDLTTTGNGLPTGNQGRIGLAVSHNNPNTVFAVYIGLDMELGGLYKTTDGGTNWTLIETINAGVDAGMMGAFGWYFGKVAVNPADDNEISLLGVDMYSTTNGGQSWAMSTPVWFLYEVHADKHDLAYAPSGKRFLATDGGLYSCTGSLFNTTWIDEEFIPCTQFYRVAYNPFQPDNYYGGAQDNGTSGGNTSTLNNWPRIYGGDGFQPAFHRDYDNVFYVETQNGNIQCTSDGGLSFNDATIGLDPNDAKSWDMPYIISHHNSDMLYTGTDRVYRNDGGQGTPWTPLSANLTKQLPNAFRPAVVSAIDESAINDQHLYAGTSDGNVWRSLDNGVTWDSLQQHGLPNRYVSSVHPSPNNVNTVFVTFSGYKANDNIPHVYRSTDNGDHWTDISSNLPSLAVNDIFVMPYYNDNVLFLATEGGVYATLDGGTNWERLGLNMPFVPVYDLELNPSTRRLMAGTFARSIMTYPLDPLLPDYAVLQSTPKPALAYSWINTSPNPASDIVSFAGINGNANLALDIYTTDAKLVKHGVLSASRQFDISDLTAGIYIVHLQSFDGRTHYATRVVKM